jgi:hypothetical protein
MRTPALVVALLGLTTFAIAAEDPFAVLTEHLEAGRCEKATPGADAWFVGDLQIAEDGTFKGAERMLLVPNKEWAAQKVEACEIRWNVTGRLTAPGKCAACEMSLAVVAKADLQASTCPEELLTGRVSQHNGAKVGGEASDFNQQYDVDVDDEGRASVRFAKSGREIGKGLYLGGRLSWVSGHQCKFW